MPRRQRRSYAAPYDRSRSPIDPRPAPRADSRQAGVSARAESRRTACPAEASISADSVPRSPSNPRATTRSESHSTRTARDPARRSSARGTAAPRSTRAAPTRGTSAHHRRASRTGRESHRPARFLTRNSYPMCQAMKRACGGEHAVLRAVERWRSFYAIQLGTNLASGVAWRGTMATLQAGGAHRPSETEGR